MEYRREKGLGRWKMKENFWWCKKQRWYNTNFFQRTDQNSCTVLRLFQLFVTKFVVYTTKKCAISWLQKMLSGASPIFQNMLTFFYSILVFFACACKISPNANQFSFCGQNKRAIKEIIVSEIKQNTYVKVNFPTFYTLNSWNLNAVNSYLRFFLMGDFFMRSRSVAFWWILSQFPFMVKYFQKVPK